MVKIGQYGIVKYQYNTYWYFTDEDALTPLFGQWRCAVVRYPNAPPKWNFCVHYASLEFIREFTVEEKAAITELGLTICS